MTYEELIERVVHGVKARRPKLELDVLRVQAEAAFPQINSQVAEAFAGRESRRPLLRSNISLTFTAGVASLPTTVLKKFIKDAELIVTPDAGQPPIYMAYLDSPDYHRTQDTRLGKWKIDGLIVTAEVPATSGAGAAPLATADVVSTVLSCISAPAVPTTASTVYAAPDDMVSEVIDALISHLVGETAEKASQAA